MIRQMLLIYYNRLRWRWGGADQQRGQLQYPEQLQPLLPTGLYYLDNLESVVESQAGSACLNTLLQTEGTRWLVSSRVALDEVPGCSIVIDRLDVNAATELFLRCWAGRAISAQEEVAEFVDRQLGGHALTITLLARLGRRYSWPGLQEKWLQQGTELARTRKGKGRIDNLEVSFYLTVEMLAETPGALDLWQFIALFPDGVDEETLELWEPLTEQTDACLALVDHHLIQEVDGRFIMLPPVARYGLAPSRLKNGPEHPFNWERTHDQALSYFLNLSENASETASSDNSIRARSRCAGQLGALNRLLNCLHDTSENVNALIRQLDYQLAHAYNFNVLVAREVLQQINVLCKSARALRALGDLESRLGHVDEARGHYDEAIELYKKERAKLGLANALKALGDLERRLGHVDEARGHYDEAIELYKKERDQLGLANTLQSQGDLLLAQGQPEEAGGIYAQAVELYLSEQAPAGLAYTLAELLRCAHRLNYLTNDVLQQRANSALFAAQASGIPDVTQYVLAALTEVLDGDEQRMEALLRSFSESEA